MDVLCCSTSLDADLDRYWQQAPDHLKKQQLDQDLDDYWKGEPISEIEFQLLSQENQDVWSMFDALELRNNLLYLNGVIRGRNDTMYAYESISKRTFLGLCEMLRTMNETEPTATSKTS